MTYKNMCAQFVYSEYFYILSWQKQEVKLLLKYIFENLQCCFQAALMCLNV